MKIVIRTLLFLTIVLLAYMCWKSIDQKQSFDRIRAQREKVIQQRLIDIRTAEVAFKDANGNYTANFDSLINFVKNGKILQIQKMGELSEELMKKGMTESKAMAIINKSKGNQKLLEKEGLWDNAHNRPILVRDTLYSSVIDARFAKRENFNPDKLRRVPFSNGQEFILKTAEIETPSGLKVKLFEAATPFETYLGDLDKTEIKTLINDTKLRPGEKYPGLRVGSIKEPNNNSGNWESL